MLYKQACVSKNGTFSELRLNTGSQTHLLRNHRVKCSRQSFIRRPLSELERFLFASFDEAWLEDLDVVFRTWSDGAGRK